MVGEKMDKPRHPQVIRTWKVERIRNVPETHHEEKDYLLYALPTRHISVGSPECLMDNHYIRKGKLMVVSRSHRHGR